MLSDLAMRGEARNLPEKCGTTSAPRLLTTVTLVAAALSRDSRHAPSADPSHDSLAHPLAPPSCTSVEVSVTGMTI